jgi:hypothetical protein
MAQFWLDMDRPLEDIKSDFVVTSGVDGVDYTVTLATDAESVPYLEFETQTANVLSFLKIASLAATDTVEISANLTYSSSTAGGTWVGVAAFMDSASGSHYGFGINGTRRSAWNYLIDDYNEILPRLDIYERADWTASITASEQVFSYENEFGSGSETRLYTTRPSGDTGIVLRAPSTFPRGLHLYSLTVGTDGDPAPTGPVGGVSTEPFLLRHNPRTNKVIPVLSSPTVTDIGATCVRPRVTKGF